MWFFNKKCTLRNNSFKLSRGNVFPDDHSNSMVPYEKSHRFRRFANLSLVSLVPEVIVVPLCKDEWSESLVFQGWRSVRGCFVRQPPNHSLTTTVSSWELSDVFPSSSSSLSILCLSDQCDLSGAKMKSIWFINCHYFYNFYLILEFLTNRPYMVLS